MYLTFAWRYFKAKKTTNAINIIAWITVSVIAVATCCQVIVLSVFNGFENLVQSLYSSFYSDLKIVPNQGKTINLTSQQLATISHQSNIQQISVIAEEKALLQNGDAQSVIYLKGVDDHYSKISNIANKIVDGKYNLGNLEKPLIVVGVGIQNAAQINVSEALPSPELTVILPKKNSESNDPLQTISEGFIHAAGVFAIQQEFDDKYGITNIDFLKQQMGLTKDEYTSVDIKLLEKSNSIMEKKNLENILGKQFNVLTKYEQNRTLYSTMRLEKWAIYIVLTLILIIAAFNMISALTMLVLEKQKDISILQSMGANRKDILYIFLSEGMLLGCIGTAVGIILATLICLLQTKFKLIKLQGGSFLIDFFPVKLLASDFILVAVTAILIAFLAACIPAIKASKQELALR